MNKVSERGTQQELKEGVDISKNSSADIYEVRGKMHSHDHVGIK
jgi:hypothetical protein